MLEENLQPLLAQFPNRHHEIARRFGHDATFHEICCDYLQLHRMVVRLREAPLDTAQRMLADYVSTLAEIESELRLVLHHTQDPAPASREEEKNDDRTNAT